MRVDILNGFYHLDCSNIINYVSTKINYFDSDANIICSEIGDGNLNLVFRVVDEKNGKSVIIKQALPFLRCVGETWPLSIYRNELESKVLIKQYELTGGMVPKIYYSDPVMHAMIMEDLSNYSIMRSALMAFKQFPFFADKITDFLVKTLLYTSDFIMEPKEKKELVKEHINPELCEITEKLVFTDPFYNAKSNNIDSYMVPFMEEHIWNDTELLRNVIKLKFYFMNHAEALLHGDLHTGSIFINNVNIKVIDPEFSFYGPIAYDIGVLLANLIMNYESVQMRCSNNALKNKHKTFLISAIEDVIDLFRNKFLKFAKVCTNQVLIQQTPVFLEDYVDDIISNAAGIAGCEMIRRTVGLAHVDDLDLIEKADMNRITKEQNILLAKSLIIKKDNIKNGKDIIPLLYMNNEFKVCLL